MFPIVGAYFFCFKKIDKPNSGTQKDRNAVKLVIKAAHIQDGNAA